MVPRAVLLAALIAVTQLTGCAVFRSYDSELQETNQQLVAGNVDAALALRKQNGVIAERADRALNGMSWDKTCADMKELIECQR